MGFHRGRLKKNLSEVESESEIGGMWQWDQRRDQKDVTMRSKDKSKTRLEARSVGRSEVGVNETAREERFGEWTHGVRRERK